MRAGQGPSGGGVAVAAGGEIAAEAGGDLVQHPCALAGHPTSHSPVRAQAGPCGEGRARRGRRSRFAKHAWSVCATRASTIAAPALANCAPRARAEPHGVLPAAARPKAACARAWRARRAETSPWSWPGSPANTSRSKNRRRSAALVQEKADPRCGVSQTRRRKSASRPGGTGSPSSRTTRRGAPAASTPVLATWTIRRRSPAPRPRPRRGRASRQAGAVQAHRSPSPAAPPSQQADRLQKIGLARAVRAMEEHRPSVQRQHGPAHRSGNRSGSGGAAGPWAWVRLDGRLYPSALA